jgi:hypothetical protein
MARYRRFAEFYPYYLSEHTDRNCRRMHFLGSALVLVVLLSALLTRRWLWLIGIPFIGYGFAWAGHFFFEKNRPATFTYPLYSLAGDWVMFAQIIRGKIRL